MNNKKQTYEKAYFALGCFWHVEQIFKKQKGVINVVVGYSGGKKRKPTYEEVCTGKTGHAETVEVTYNPAETTYKNLLKIFWKSHDPTSLNKQGPDIGNQYRSAIFYLNSSQKRDIVQSKKEFEEKYQPKNNIVTEIAPFNFFCKAERYHQGYFERHGNSVCSVLYSHK